MSAATASVEHPAITTSDPKSSGEGGKGGVPDATRPPAVPANMVASNSSAATPSGQGPGSGHVQSKAQSTSPATSASTLMPIATTPTAPKPPKRKPRLPVDAVLGIVFGLIGVGGAGLGFVVWRIRRRRLMSQED